MSLLAMPLIVANLGCEMLYILQQRLVAQNIPSDKSVKVLHDVVRAMFEPSFVSQLFVPQTLFTVQSTRTIFDKLAHSSIMRLSEASMDKLFDLMMMGVKFQLLCCKEPSEFIKVTLNHLRQVWKIIQSEGDQFASNLYSKMESTYGSLTDGQWELLRQNLCAFFQDKRVKVSLFLQEGIQNSLGCIILPSPVVNRSRSTGEVTVFNSDGDHKKVHKLDALDTNPDEFFQHPLELGSDLYDKARPRVTPPKRHISTWSRTQSRKKSAEKEPPQPPSSDPQQSNPQQGAKEGPPPETNAKPARSEATLLASLMSRPAQPSKDKVKLNLMFDDPMIDIVKDAPNQATNTDRPPVFKSVEPVQANSDTNNSYKKNLLGELSDLNVEGADTNNDGEDLLDLLDGME
ncbi:hypothetical protein BSKO_10840 [Bryopsis sp. KO-2023]|nr:hypothetical protein BSKO_10840 [Bryopsis sp. KO-2023]